MQTPAGNPSMKEYPYRYIDYQVDRQAKIATVTLSNPKRRNVAPVFAEDQLIEAMARHPRLIERPVFVNAGRAVIGRPPEQVLELLD